MKNIKTRDFYIEMIRTDGVNVFVEACKVCDILELESGGQKVSIVKTEDGNNYKVAGTAQEIFEKIDNCRDNISEIKRQRIQNQNQAWKDGESPQEKNTNAKS